MTIDALICTINSWPILHMSAELLNSKIKLILFIESADEESITRWMEL